MLQEVFCEMGVGSDTEEKDLMLIKDEIWFDGYEDNPGAKIHDSIVQKMKKVGIRKVAVEIARYLEDESNHEKAEEFIESIN